MMSNFSKTILNILNDESLKSRIVSNAFETATHHSSKEFGDKLEELYKKVIEDYKNRKSLKKISLTKKVFRFY